MTSKSELKRLAVQAGTPTPEREALVKRLDELRITHHTCDDCWYSCPASGDCCNEFSGNECDCGADEHNAKLDAILAALTAQGSAAEPVAWMQSDHLNKLVMKHCGSQSMLARVSDHQLQSDYIPLYASPAKDKP